MSRFREVLGASLLVFVIGCGNGGSLGTEASCSDGVDDDEDELIDCDDDDCANDSACQAPSFDVPDPEDLPGPDGDPSLDLEGVDIALDGTTVTCDVFVYGTWPPDPELYSYFLVLELLAEDSLVASATTQRHDGTDSTFGTGVPPTAITVTPGVQHVRLVVTDLPAGVTHFNVEAGVQKTPSGNRVTDRLSPTPLAIPAN